MLDVPIVAGEAGKPDSTFEVVGKFTTGEQYGAIVPKDSPNLTAFDTALGQLKSEGVIEGLLKKYFPAAASVPEIK
jgi:polar amino acid transport system substrate-binding protein